MVKGLFREGLASLYMDFPSSVLGSTFFSGMNTRSFVFFAMVFLFAMVGAEGMSWPVQFTVDTFHFLGAGTATL